jgi:6,7-dimethyl-8-ribityllumazine synthase
MRRSAKLELQSEGKWRTSPAMSKAFPPRPRASGGKSDHSYAIVASRFNETYVQAMVDRAHGELNALDPEAQVVLVWTPGSFEIPLFVQTTAALKRFDAILALGVILQGGTAHATLIAESVTKALLDISLAHRVPVIHEVLLLQNEDQAKERCLGDQHNRGVEAARAAVFAARKLSEIA